MIIIRKANLFDIDTITEIYNDAVVSTTATFDIEPKNTDEMRRWFAKHGPRHPILVAELDGQIIGWASLSKWSERNGYSDTAEVSVYVKDGFRGKGVGKKLLIDILKEGKKAELHTVVGRIVEGNDVSICLAESVGFVRIGTMREVGRKFGKLLDVHLMQIILDAESWVTSPNNR